MAGTVEGSGSSFERVGRGGMEGGEVIVSDGEC